MSETFCFSTWSYFFLESMISVSCPQNNYECVLFQWKEQSSCNFNLEKMHLSSSSKIFFSCLFVVCIPYGLKGENCVKYTYFWSNRIKPWKCSLKTIWKISVPRTTIIYILDIFTCSDPAKRYQLLLWNSIWRFW